MSQRRLTWFNPFPNKPWFLGVCSTSLLKTLWEKDKLFVTSNFSFSHSVFYRLRELSVVFIKFEIVLRKLLQSGGVQNWPFGKGLKPLLLVSFLQVKEPFFLQIQLIVMTCLVCLTLSQTTNFRLQN